MIRHPLRTILDNRILRRASRAGSALAALAGALLLAGCVSAPVPVVTVPTVPTVTIPSAAPRLPRVGLALGGGAARGFAHVGVIQVL